MEAEPALKEMPISDRKCMFKDDPHQLKLFKNYTRSACLLECLLKQIISKCNCLPWDFLYNREYSYILPCISIQAKCPLKVLESSSDYGCDCPVDCNEIRYTSTIQPKVMDVRPFCHQAVAEVNNSYTLQAAWNQIVPNVIDPFNLHPEKTFAYRTPFQQCHAFSVWGARVEISYSSSTAKRTVKLKRLTFAGMLSSFGEYEYI